MNCIIEILVRILLALLSLAQSYQVQAVQFDSPKPCPESGIVLSMDDAVPIARIGFEGNGNCYTTAVEINLTIGGHYRFGLVPDINFGDALVIATNGNVVVETFLLEDEFVWTEELQGSFFYLLPQTHSNAQIGNAILYAIPLDIRPYNQYDWTGLDAYRAACQAGFITGEIYCGN